MVIGTYYYPWFKEDGIHWGNFKYNSLLGQYDSGDITVIREHFKDIKSCHIDFIALSWWGKQDLDINRNCITIMQELESDAFDLKFCILAEMDRGNDPEYIYQTYTHSPKYQYLNGKPLVLTWLIDMLDNRFTILKADQNWIPKGIYPGIDVPHLKIERSLADYERRIKANWGTIPLMFMTWNDFQESTCIEPTEEYGYDYVEKTRTTIEYLREGVGLGLPIAIAGFILGIGILSR